MMVFHLMGGLGNQMFAYAAARSLALSRNLDVVYDFDCPYKHITYKYELDIFNLVPSWREATGNELRRVKPKRGLIRRLYLLLGQNPAPFFIKETKEFTFNEDLYTCKDPAYLSGFWQAHGYVQRCENQIRQEFTFRNKPDAINQELMDKMQSCQAVAIHIRRGDYVNVPSTQAIHGACSPAYYHAAMQWIETQIAQPRYFVFSNDLAWVKENITIGGDPVYVDHNKGPLSFEDVRLMSNCKHAIIANSSFSWWGAWLIPFTEKIIVAPQRWMADPSIDTRDLIPPGWTLM